MSSGQMSSGQMSLWVTIFMGKFRLGKYPSCQTLYGQMSVGKCLWANVVFENLMEQLLMVMRLNIFPIATPHFNCLRSFQLLICVGALTLVQQWMMLEIRKMPCRFLSSAFPLLYLVYGPTTQADV
jgi:hypothetical protein